MRNRATRTTLHIFEADTEDEESGVLMAYACVEAMARKYAATLALSSCVISIVGT